jgi:hypothetical protein
MVVQWIARLTDDELNRCRASPYVLDRLIWFELRPEEDYLNLGWSGSVLERYFAHSEQLAEVQKALSMIMYGAREVVTDRVAAGYSYDAANGVTVGSQQITHLNPQDVRLVAETFRRLDIVTLLRWLPSDVAEAWHMLGKDTISPPDPHPNAFYKEYLENLIAFYATAADRGMATVTWWD